MSGRFTTKITNSKHKSYNNMSDTAVAILGAGVGSRIKSHEPRSLIKIGDKTLIEHQVSMIRNSFENPEIIGVVVLILVSQLMISFYWEQIMFNFILAWYSKDPILLG